MHEKRKDEKESGGERKLERSEREEKSGTKKSLGIMAAKKSREKRFWRSLISNTLACRIYLSYWIEKSVLGIYL